MDGPAMHMSDFSMPVIGLWMDMEQGCGEHPERRPDQDRYA